MQGSVLIVLLIVALIPFFLLVAGAVLASRWMKWQMESHQKAQNQWEVERERLLNRCMTREWASYVQMQSAMMTSTSPSISPEEARGLSDEEELRRVGADLANAQELGEVYVEFDDGYSGGGLITG